MTLPRKIPVFTLPLKSLSPELSLLFKNTSPICTAPSSRKCLAGLPVVIGFQMRRDAGAVSRKKETLWCFTYIGLLQLGYQSNTALFISHSFDINIRMLNSEAIQFLHPHSKEKKLTYYYMQKKKVLITGIECLDFGLILL